MLESASVSTTKSALTPKFEVNKSTDLLVIGLLIFNSDAILPFLVWVIIVLVICPLTTKSSRDTSNLSPLEAVSISHSSFSALPNPLSISSCVIRCLSNETILVSLSRRIDDISSPLPPLPITLTLLPSS